MLNGNLCSAQIGFVAEAIEPTNVKYEYLDGQKVTIIKLLIQFLSNWGLFLKAFNFVGGIGFVWSSRVLERLCESNTF